MGNFLINDVWVDCVPRVYLLQVWASIGYLIGSSKIRGYVSAGGLDVGEWRTASSISMPSCHVGEFQLLFWVLQ